jgi:hypothetical protein
MNTPDLANPLNAPRKSRRSVDPLMDTSCLDDPIPQEAQFSVAAPAPARVAPAVSYAPASAPIAPIAPIAPVIQATPKPAKPAKEGKKKGDTRMEVRLSKLTFDVAARAWRKRITIATTNRDAGRGHRMPTLAGVVSELIELACANEALVEKLASGNSTAAGSVDGNDKE